MKRKRTYPLNTNYWPGYVDALSNVVLNLLFLVAMLVISAGVFGALESLSPRSPATTPDPMPVSRTESGSLLAEAIKKISESWAPAPSPVRVDTSDTSGASDAAETPAMKPSPEVSQETAHWASIQRQSVRTKADTSTQKAAKTSPSGDLAGIAANARTEAAPSDMAALARLSAVPPTDKEQMARAVQQATPDTESKADSSTRTAEGRSDSEPSAGQAPSHLAGISTQALVITEGNRMTGGPHARILRRSSNNRAFFEIVLPVAAQPLAEMRREPLRATLRKAIPTQEGQKLLLWANVSPSDEQAKRNAYLALAELRNNLVAQGWPTTSVTMRLLPVSGAAPDHLRLFIAAHE